MQKAKTAIAVLALVLLAGCKVGHGSKPVSMIVQQKLDEPAGTVAKSYTCVPAQLILLGTFDNGERGEFSYRARWTSSNPEIVDVSNFGQPTSHDPTKLYSTGGTLLPLRAVAEGEEDPTITAHYLDFTSSIKVHVAASSNIHITPAPQVVLPNTFQIIHLTADTADGTQEITGSSTFTFINPDDSVALVSTEAEVISIKGVAPGGPLTVKAETFVPCADTANITGDYTIATIPPDGLKLDYEKDFYGPGDTVGSLARNTGQVLQLNAHFGDLNGNGVEDPEEVQDLAGQAGGLISYDVDGDGICEWSNEGPAADSTPPISFGGLLGGVTAVQALNVDRGGADKTVLICGGYGQGEDPDGTGPLLAGPLDASAPLPITIKDVKLSDMLVSVSDPCNTADTFTCTPIDDPVHAVADGDTINMETGQAFRFVVHGTFVGNYQQDISKDVTLVTGNSTVVAVANGGAGTAGLVATYTLTTFDNIDGCDLGDPTVRTCNVDVKVEFDQGDTDASNDVIKTFHILVSLPPEDEAASIAASSLPKE